MLKAILLSLSLTSAIFAQNVVLETNQGTMEFELFEDKAPLATENFKTHVSNGYYNGITFHRIIKNFMIQGGDPTGTGRGGKSIWNQPFEDEFSDEKFTGSGILAMANAGPKTNGSQFFITTAATPWLNNKHTIFGKLVSGFDVLRQFEQVDTGYQDKPKEKQYIIKAYLKN